MNAYLISILEVIVVAFTVWCLFNEAKIAGIEKRIMRKIRRKKFKVIKGGKSAKRNYA
jgi:hypothetical protein